MAPTHHDTFSPIHNPYIVGNPIRDRDMFFGREDDFQYIRQKVTGEKRGGLIVLCGTRRSGKTSILFQVMQGRLGDDFVPVLIDMQAMVVKSDLDFLTKLGRAIVDTIDHPDLSLEDDFLREWDTASFSAFDKLVRKAIGQLDGRKLILLVDEYEILESHIEKKFISTEVLNLFRSWMDHEENICMVFTGSDRLEERDPECWGAFLSKALHRRISFLSRDDTIRLIEEPLRDVIRYENGLPDQIYKLTAGQPFYTQVLCQALVDHLNEAGTYDVSPSDLQSVVGQIIENPLPQMIFSWNSLTQVERLALSAIGELNKEEVRPVTAADILTFMKEEKVSYRIRRNNLNETLEALFHHDLLSKEGSSDAYTFRMDLWRLWMGRMHSIWQVVDEIKGADHLDAGIVTPGGGKKRMLITVAAGAAAAAFAVIYFTGGNDEPVIPAVAAVDSTWLTIRTDPPGAEVFLGDRLIGESPVEEQRVVAAGAALLVRLPGYHDYRDTLQLTPELAVDTTIALAEKTASLIVTSEPEGAQIYLDGEQRGVTPAEFADLSLNRPHEVRVRKAGFDDFVARNVTLDADATQTLNATLSTSRSEVLLASVPSGAEVYIDGERRGVTPGTYRLAYGSHAVEFRLDGYQASRRSLDLSSPSGRLDVAMEKLPPGVLRIRIYPYASIFVNDELKKRHATNDVISLDQGSYTLRFEHPELPQRTEVVAVVSGDTTTVKIDMRSRGGQQ